MIVVAGTGMKMRELLGARRGCTPSACGRDSRKGPSLLAFIATAMAALGAIVPVAVVCYGATAVGSGPDTAHLRRGHGNDRAPSARSQSPGLFKLLSGGRDAL